MRARTGARRFERGSRRSDRRDRRDRSSGRSGLTFSTSRWIEGSARRPVSRRRCDPRLGSEVVLNRRGRSGRTMAASLGNAGAEEHDRQSQDPQILGHVTPLSSLEPREATHCRSDVVSLAAPRIREPDVPERAGPQPHRIVPPQLRAEVLSVRKGTLRTEYQWRIIMTFLRENAKCYLSIVCDIVARSMD